MPVADKLPLYKPMLAVPARPFDHPDYYFEIKWDGYRCLAYLQDKGTTLVSRNLHDISDTFPDLQDLHQRVREVPAILDGEIIILREGRPSFAALQSRARLTNRERVARAAITDPALYMAFDVLYCAGGPLLNLWLSKRLRVLQSLIDKNERLLVSEGVIGKGKDFFKACVDKGLEGVVAKRLDGRYLPGTRSLLWKKIRATREADLVICGYRKGKGERLLGSLVLGAWDGDKFIYQGMVGTGIGRDEEHFLLDMLGNMEHAEATIDNTVNNLRGVKWVEPELVCRVEFLALTGRGILRHPVYKGLRRDKNPRECVPVELQCE